MGILVRTGSRSSISNYYKKKKGLSGLWNSLELNEVPRERLHKWPAAFNSVTILLFAIIFAVFFASDTHSLYHDERQRFCRDEWQSVS